MSTASSITRPTSRIIGEREISEMIDSLDRRELYNNSTIKTTRGSMVRRSRRLFHRANFTGEAWIRGHRFYDPALTDDHTGTAITDESTDGAKTWLRVEIGANFIRVTYVDGPPPNPFPANVEYFRCSNCGQVHIPGF